MVPHLGLGCRVYQPRTQSSGGGILQRKTQMCGLVDDRDVSYLMSWRGI